MSYCVSCRNAEVFKSNSCYYTTLSKTPVINITEQPPCLRTGYSVGNTQVECNSEFIEDSLDELCRWVYL